MYIYIYLYIHTHTFLPISYVQILKPVCWMYCMKWGQFLDPEARHPANETPSVK